MDLPCSFNIEIVDFSVIVCYREHIMEALDVRKNDYWLGLKENNTAREFVSHPRWMPHLTVDPTLECK